MTVPPTLDDHLAAAYKATIGQGPPADPYFRAALRANPVLLEQARIRLAAISADDIQQKDHISRVHKKTLERVLAGL